MQNSDVNVSSLTIKLIEKKEEVAWVDLSGHYRS